MILSNAFNELNPFIMFSEVINYPVLAPILINTYRCEVSLFTGVRPEPIIPA